MTNKFYKIKEWLSDCPYLNGYTYFNVVPDVVGNQALTSDANVSGTLKEFTDGTKEVELLFNIYVVCDYDKGTSEVNLEAMELFEKVSEWIKAQNEIKNFPDFGENIVYLIEGVYTNPDVFLSQDEKKCQYEAKYRICFLERN